MRVLLAVALVLAGCLQATAPADVPEEDTPPVAAEPGALPEGQRVLSDLKAFTALAPRRYDNLFDHDAARDWLVAQFEDADLTVARDRFTGAAQTTGEVEGQNIVATVPGATNRTIILGAHYDSAVTSAEAAYDDGTGTMLVVELARAAATYTWNHTLLFIAFDQEEAGLVGSTHHAAAMRAQGVDLVCMLNYDMVGINWPAGIGGRANPIPLNFFAGGEAEQELVAIWQAALAATGYPAAASTQSTGLGGGSSDHGPYRNAEFNAAWLRGALIGSYPAYHNADTVEAMAVIVGGDEANLVAGFQTVLDLSLAFVQVLDGQTVTPRLAG